MKSGSDGVNTVAQPFADFDGDGAHWGHLDVAAGVRLRHAFWRSSPAQVRGTVVLLHGRTEFIEKYFEVIGELLSRGFDVFTFDWRGQGASTRELADGHKGHIRGFETYLEDLSAALARGLAGRGRGPQIMMGHSMGGSLGLQWLARHPTPFALAIFTNPMLGLCLPVPVGLMKVMVRVLRAVGRGTSYLPTRGAYGRRDLRFAGNRLTSDKERFERTCGWVASCPHLALGGPTVDWLHGALESMDALAAPELGRAIQAPTLLVCGSEDRVIDIAACDRLAARVAAVDTFTIPGAAHEVFAEQDAHREVLWRQLDAFLHRHLPPR